MCIVSIIIIYKCHRTYLFQLRNLKYSWNVIKQGLKDTIASPLDSIQGQNPTLVIELVQW